MNLQPRIQVLRLLDRQAAHHATVSRLAFRYITYTLLLYCFRNHHDVSEK